MATGRDNIAEMFDKYQAGCFGWNNKEDIFFWNNARREIIFFLSNEKNDENDDLKGNLVLSSDRPAPYAAPPLILI